MNEGRVYIKIYTKNLKGEDIDVTNLEIYDGKLIVQKKYKPLKENIRKMDKK